VVVEEEAQALTELLDSASETAESKVKSENLTVPPQWTSILDKVERQILQFRVVLAAAEAKNKERVWLPLQHTGELDEGRLVDGVTGEQNIFKRRGEPVLPEGHQQTLPKRLAFLVDISNSMSRFNSWDGRLDRMCQTVAMLMETLEGFQHKFDYTIIGHSGSSANLCLVPFGNPPRTAQARYEVITQMYSHARGASSGDNTLEALKFGVRDVAQHEGDDRLVFLVSDANLGRYGVTPDQLAMEMQRDPTVSAYAIFIAEANAAEALAEGLPFGHSFVCLDVPQLPTTFKEIFTHASKVLDHF